MTKTNGMLHAPNVTALATIGYSAENAALFASITTAYEQVSPQQARAWVQGNEAANRNIVEAAVQRLMYEMASDSYVSTNDTFVIGTPCASLWTVIHSPSVRGARGVPDSGGHASASSVICAQNTYRLHTNAGAAVMSRPTQSY